MLRKATLLVILGIVITLLYEGSALAEDKMDQESQFEVTAKGIERIRFRDLSFTDLVYTGIPGAQQFDIQFKRTVYTRDEEDFEEMLSRLNLDIEISGKTVTLRLRHPKHNTSGILNRMFDRKKWHVQIEVTGPDEMDIDIDASFSDITTKETIGNLDLDVSFSETKLEDHSGLIRTDASF